MEASYEVFTSNLNQEIPVPRAYFKLKLKRNPTFYNLFMIFPCIIVFSEYNVTYLRIFTARNSRCRKVMFSHLLVILSRGGV